MQAREGHRELIREQRALKQARSKVAQRSRKSAAASAPTVKKPTKIFGSKLASGKLKPKPVSLHPSLCSMSILKYAHGLIVRGESLPLEALSCLMTLRCCVSPPDSCLSVCASMNVF